MIYDNKNKTFYLDNEDAMLVLGKEEFNKLRKSGDLYKTSRTSAGLSSAANQNKLFKPEKVITNNKRVRCIETGEEFDSISEVNLKYGFHKSNISLCCNGKLKTANGYKWEYI